MAGSLKIINNSAITYLGYKFKTYPLFLLCNRNYCAKNNDSSDQNFQSKDNKGDTTKHSEKSVEKSNKARDEKLQFSEKSKAAAKQKLMSLLSEITVSSDIPSKKISNLNLARPLKRQSKKERLQAMKDQQITPQKEMDMAVKAVASSFKADTEKIESELSEKLSSLKMSEEKNIINKIDDQISENVMSSVKEVAATISESPIPPRSELTKRLLRMSLDQKDSLEMKKTMKSVIETMKLEPKSTLSSKESPVITRKREVPKPPLISKIDLFGSKPLNIFQLDTGTKAAVGNAFWQKIQEKQLRLLTQFAPANGFEEMIMWTEQGKHWKLPIDNQTEMGAEEKVGFNEHVFLEHHLKGFPTHGPIRHFMELVVVGMSKNPYITVERKIENIEWFRNYFNEKEDILKETGALE